MKTTFTFKHPDIWCPFMRVNGDQYNAEARYTADIGRRGAHTVWVMVRVRYDDGDGWKEEEFRARSIEAINKVTKKYGIVIDSFPEDVEVTYHRI